MEGNGIKKSDRTGWIRFLRGAWLGTYGWLLLAMVAVIPQALDPHIGSNVTRVIANTATLFFLTYILTVIFNDIFKTSRVTIDTLVGALCGYLLIAAMFAAVYSTVLLFDSSAFLIDSALGVDPANLHFQGTHFGVLTYYSIMTLTTVGYGDVVPASTISRGFVSIEAVIGQIYLTVIVARLVGMHLTASMK